MKNGNPLGLTDEQIKRGEKRGFYIKKIGNHEALIGLDWDQFKQWLKTQDWKDYQDKITLTTAITLPLMNYRDEEKPDVKLAIYKIMAHLGLSPDEEEDIFTLTDLGLQMTEEQDAEFYSLLRREVMSLMRKGLL